MLARDNDMDSTMFGLEELIELIEELRLAGYDIGTQQCISAHGLLLTLAACRQLPANPRDLDTWLAPLLCSSPKEQQHFYQHYRDWLERHPHLLKRVTKEDQAGKAKSVSAAGSSDGPTRSRFINPKFLGIAGGVVLAVMAGFVLYVQFVPRTLSGTLIDADDTTPLYGATIQFAGQTLQSDNQGQFLFNYRHRNATATVEISLKKYESLPVTFNGQRFRTAETLGEIRLHKAPSSETVDGRSLIATPPLLTPSDESFFKRHFALIRALTVLLPLLIFVAWWLLREYKRRMLLQKLSSARDPLLKRIVVKGAAAQLFRGQGFRRLAQKLRRHRSLVSRDVDAQLTVQATVEKGGLFVPFYASRKTLPEYLTLIDRVSAADQQARFHGELINRLLDDNVFVDHYYYNDDPRICRMDSKQASFFSLQDLASRHPDHHLMIFSDGSGLINRLTGEPEEWLNVFSAWPGRALMTPESPAQWSYREWALADLDFVILPASPEGLAALVDVSSTGTPTKMDGVSSQPFPELLRVNPDRWLERHGPQASLTTRFREQLQTYLGAERFHWLCACAVYPTLSWDLTLYFGYKLLDNHENFEEKLLTLVRLPWFRHGDMPNWLRLQLISAMSLTQESAVRQMLQDLLISLMENPGEGISLEIASRPKEVAPRSWRRFARVLPERLRKLRRQAKLRRFLSALPEESPLRDYVFLSFMSGRKPRKLDVSVPEMLRRILYPQGQRSLSLRPATAFTFAVIVSLAGLATMNASRPNPETPRPIVEASSTPVATPSVLSPIQIETFKPDASPNPSPTVLPVSSDTEIARVPNGAKLIININWEVMRFDEASFVLKQFEWTRADIKQIGSRRLEALRPQTPVTFTDLPAGIFDFVFKGTPDPVWYVKTLSLRDREVRELTIPGERGSQHLITPSPLPSVGITPSPSLIGESPTPVTPTVAPVVIIDTSNTSAVTSTPTRQVSFTIRQTYLITNIWNYHWNNGRGASAGTISLRNSDGTIFGPWKVITGPGQGGARDVDWECTPNVQIPAGTYTVIDSSPESWSANPLSGGKGFTRVRGVPMP